MLSIYKEGVKAGREDAASDLSDRLRSKTTVAPNTKRMVHGLINEVNSQRVVISNHLPTELFSREED
jgi:hypothetical protein